jgi:hypothetical protein
MWNQSKTSGSILERQLQMAQDLPAKANVPTSMDFSQENDT